MASLLPLLGDGLVGVLLLAGVLVGGGLGGEGGVQLILESRRN